MEKKERKCFFYVFDSKDTAFMKVVQINAVYEFSSTGRTSREMHEYLQSQGYDSYVFCANLNRPKDHIYRVGNDLEHKLHALGSRLFGLQGYFSHFSTKLLLSKLRVIKPDIVILRNFHANYINIPMVLRYLGENDIPTIIVLHDCFFFTGHCCYYTKDNCDKWKTECYHCPILDKYNSSLFFDNSRRIFNDKKKYFKSIKKLAVVGVSNWVTSEAKQSPILSGAYIIKRIYNWIDQSVFYPRNASSFREKYGIKEDDYVVLGVAQGWGDVKGLPQFIKLAQEMSDIKVVLVGELTQSDLPQNLIRIGRISSTEQLAMFYSMADVFVNFSIQETFGKVAAEALSCGTPVIVNQSTANPELCGEGCGKIVAHRDWKEVMDKVIEIRKEGKSTYTERCRSFAVQNFNKEKGLMQYIDLFKELVN